MDDIRKAVLSIIDCIKQKPISKSSDVSESSKECFEQEKQDFGDIPENLQEEQNCVEKQFQISIAKSNEEQQTVTGIVLQPEVVDGQGDIMSADVIQDAAHAFLMNFNKKTKLGIQHQIFKASQLALVESWITPMNLVIGVNSVKQGSWIMTVKVLDSKIWEKVKQGAITGFSIGGKARVIPVKED